MSTTQPQPSDARERVIASASRLGVQLNEAELERWMSAVTTTNEGDNVVMDERTGVFGHKISMLDFDPQQLARFRAIGKIVAQFYKTLQGGCFPVEEKPQGRREG